MTTNEVIGAVLVALGTILGVGIPILKPLITGVRDMTKAMTELTFSVKVLTDKFNKFEVNNHDDHKRIWQKNDEQDKELIDHETRITLIENRN